MLTLVHRTSSLVPRAIATEQPTPEARVLFAELARFSGSEGLSAPRRYYDLVKKYGSSVWTYAAVSRKAQDEAAVPLKIYRRTPKTSAKDEQLDEVEETHPLRQLLRMVNPFMTAYDLTELDSINLSLAGNDYWLFFGMQGKPVEVWPLRPDWVTVVPSATNFLAGYVVRVEGGPPKPFLPISASKDGTGILHFKRQNPWNYWYGQGPLEAAYGAVTTDEKAVEYRHQFFANSARPDGILSTDSHLTDSKVEMIREWWRSAFQGSANAYRTAIMDSSLKYQAISISPKDADLVNDRRLSRDDQVVAYGVPLAALGAVDAGDVGDRESQVRHYWESTIKPSCIRRASTLTELVAPRYGPDVEVHPDFSQIKPLQEDEERRARIDQIRLQGGVVTINEVRARDNLDAVAWGDVPLVPFSLAPLGEGGGFGVGDPLLGLTGPPTSHRKVWALPLALPRHLPADGRASPEGEVERAALWEGLIARSVPIERSLEGQIRRVFAVTADALTGAMKTLGSPSAAVTDALAGTMHPLLVRVSRDALPIAMRTGWRRAIELVAAVADKSHARWQTRAQEYDVAFDMAIPQLADYIAQRPIRYADGITVRLAADMRELMGRLANEGASIDQIADAVHERFETISEARAQLIARTEVGAASNLASHTAMIEAGVEKHEWLSARDDLVRRTHRLADGQVVPLTDRFKVGAALLRYPGDPEGPIDEIADCRCVPIPVVKEV